MTGRVFESICLMLYSDGMNESSNRALQKITDFCLYSPEPKLYSFFVESAIECNTGTICGSFVRYKRHLDRVRRGIDFPVPYSEYWIVCKEQWVAGYVQIRHKPSASVLIGDDLASHTYVALRPSIKNRISERDLLNKMLGEAKKLGLYDLRLRDRESGFDWLPELTRLEAKLITKRYVPRKQREIALYSISI